MRLLRKAAALKLLFAQLEKGIKACQQKALPKAIARLEGLHLLAKQRQGGRPPAQVDYTQVQAYAEKGIKAPGTIARLMGIPRDTLLSPVHRSQVLDAIETGRARWELWAHEQYDNALRGEEAVSKSKTVLCIFLMKQLGWSDKQVVSTGQPSSDVSGARERLLALVERYKASHTA